MVDSKSDLKRLRASPLSTGLPNHDQITWYTEWRWKKLETSDKSATDKNIRAIKLNYHGQSKTGEMGQM